MWLVLAFLTSNASSTGEQQQWKYAGTACTVLQLIEPQLQLALGPESVSFVDAYIVKAHRNAARNVVFLFCVLSFLETTCLMILYGT